MPNPQYLKGTRGERRAAGMLRSAGYYVWLARGSKGFADLLAVKIGEILLVQVKAGGFKGNRWPVSHEGWNGLFDLGELIGGVALVAEVPDRGLVKFRRILGPHRERSQLWPCVEWQPDPLGAAQSDGTKTE